MKRIAVEEHFSTQEHVDCLVSIIQGKYPVAEVVQEGKTMQRDLPWISPSLSSDPVQVQARLRKLLDLGQGRLKDMDEAGIDVQVLSLACPGVQVLDAAAANSMSRKINDQLSQVVRQYPERFIGLATVAPQDPVEAASELRRAVLDLGLKGACINSHTRGEYLDDKKYWVILEAAQDLDVPIYIHPRAPSPDMIKPYLGYPGLASAILGYSAEVSLHSLRLIFSGVFDAFPRLKIGIGHLGEGLPYWMWRIDHMWQRRTGGKIIKRNPSDYIKDNFLFSTSGMLWHPALLCAYLSVGADNILFAADYPFESNQETISSIESAPICTTDREKIMHSNAEKIFKL